MKQHLIYTALVGSNYDNIISLSMIDDRFDYICFVRKGDKKSEFIGNWRIVELDTVVEDNARLSRFPKLVPHKTEVANYEYSLYTTFLQYQSKQLLYNLLFLLLLHNKHTYLSQSSCYLKLK